MDEKELDKKELDNTCHLFGAVGIAVQICMGILVIIAMIGKRKLRIKS